MTNKMNKEKQLFEKVRMMKTRWFFSGYAFGSAFWIAMWLLHRLTINI